MTLPTEEQIQEIEKLVKHIARFMRDNDIPLEIASSATMLLCAKLCAPSNNSNDNIVGQFRLCLEIEREDIYAA